MTSVQPTLPNDPPQNGMRVPRPVCFVVVRCLFLCCEVELTQVCQCCVTAGITILFVFV